jgi:hypothetical protein
LKQRISVPPQIVEDRIESKIKIDGQGGQLIVGQAVVRLQRQGLMVVSARDGADSGLFVALEQIELVSRQITETHKTPVEHLLHPSLIDVRFFDC